MSRTAASALYGAPGYRNCHVFCEDPGLFKDGLERIVDLDAFLAQFDRSVRLSDGLW